VYKELISLQITKICYNKNKIQYETRTGRILPTYR